MHETKFANDIIFILNNKLDKGMSSKPITVNVKLSPFSHVTPPRLKETFDLLIKGEKFKDVKLNVTPMEFEAYCRSCRAVSKSDKAIFNCPRCGSPDFDINKEREFYVDNIEVESA